MVIIDFSYLFIFCPWSFMVFDPMLTDDKYSPLTCLLSVKVGEDCLIRRGRLGAWRERVNGRRLGVLRSRLFIRESAVG